MANALTTKNQEWNRKDFISISIVEKGVSYFLKVLIGHFYVFYEVIVFSFFSSSG